MGIFAGLKTQVPVVDVVPGSKIVPEPKVEHVESLSYRTTQKPKPPETLPVDDPGVRECWGYEYKTECHWWQARTGARVETTTFQVVHDGIPFQMCPAHEDKGEELYGFPPGRGVGFNRESLEDK